MLTTITIDSIRATIAAARLAIFSLVALIALSLSGPSTANEFASQSAYAAPGIHAHHGMAQPTTTGAEHCLADLIVEDRAYCDGCTLACCAHAATANALPSRNPLRAILPGPVTADLALAATSVRPARHRTHISTFGGKRNLFAVNVLAYSHRLRI